MSILGDAVKARVALNVLSNLTNDAPVSPAAVDDVMLELGVTDVTADWLTYTQVAFDETDAQHIALTVRGVQLWLIRRKQETSGADDYAAWLKEINATFRHTTHNNRITPQTSFGMRPKVPRYQEHQEFEGPLDDLIPDGNLRNAPE